MFPLQQLDYPFFSSSIPKNNAPINTSQPQYNWALYGTTKRCKLSNTSRGQVFLNLDSLGYLLVNYSALLNSSPIISIYSNIGPQHLTILTPNTHYTLTEKNRKIISLLNYALSYIKVSSEKLLQSQQQTIIFVW